MNQKKISLFLLSTISSALILTSCSGTESYKKKMNRYETKAVTNNKVPDFKTSDFVFKNQNNFVQEKSTRAPASVVSDETATKAESIESNPTNKKLYFLNLLSEYENLQKYTPSYASPALAICPNFHTSLLRHNDSSVAAFSSTKSSVNQVFTYDSTKFNDERYVASRPELLLPVSKDDINPKVIDIIKNSKKPFSDIAINEMIQTALTIHLTNTYSELSELCETGSSNNYYIYENLSTHIKNNKFEADTKNMNILLKTTIFSNIALLSSLEKQYNKSQGRAIASVSDTKKDNLYSKEVMSRLNVSWANQYFDYIKESH